MYQHWTQQVIHDYVQEGPVIGPAHARAHLFFCCIARGQVTGLRFGDTAE